MMMMKGPALLSLKWSWGGGRACGFSLLQPRTFPSVSLSWPPLPISSPSLQPRPTPGAPREPRTPPALPGAASLLNPHSGSALTYYRRLRCPVPVPPWLSSLSEVERLEQDYNKHTTIPSASWTHSSSAFVSSHNPGDFWFLTFPREPSDLITFLSLQSATFSSSEMDCTSSRVLSSLSLFWLCLFKVCTPGTQGWWAVEASGGGRLGVTISYIPGVPGPSRGEGGRKIGHVCRVVIITIMRSSQIIWHLSIF